MEAKQEGLEDPDVAFAKRLERVRAAGSAAPSQGSSKQQQQEVNMIDVGRPQYDSPPPLTKTLFGAASDGGAGSEGSAFGLPQARPQLPSQLCQIRSSSVCHCAPAFFWTHNPPTARTFCCLTSSQPAIACDQMHCARCARSAWRSGRWR